MNCKTLPWDLGDSTAFDLVSVGGGGVPLDDNPEDFTVSCIVPTT